MNRRQVCQRMIERVLVFFALLAAVLPGPLSAGPEDRNTSGPVFDPTLVEQWQESPTPLPPPPAADRLLHVPLGPADTLKLYIDPISLSRPKDGVARLTLVLETPGGVRNVFHEGLRCETREYKIYAIGRPDGTWMPLKSPEWRRIEFLPTNAYRHYLATHVICDNKSSARTPADLIRLIKYPPTHNE